MNIQKSKIIAVLLACSAWCSMQQAHAFFEDDEARRHILDLREKKADKSSIVELAAQNEAMKQEISGLRGQVEVLTQKVTDLESRQKDFYVDLDERLKKLESPNRGTAAPVAAVAKQSSDSKPADQTTATAAEQKADAEEEDFDYAEGRFDGGHYKVAIAAYTKFVQKYPESHYLARAYYQIGNAYYLQKDYKTAYKNQNIVIRRFPRNPIAPDAMLNMATCQIGMNDVNGAKKTLNDLTVKYPSSKAAKRAKSILSQL